MKKILLIILLLLSVTICYSQIAPPKQQIKLNLPPISAQQSRFPMGVGMMLGGAVLTTAGLLTPPLMVGGSTTQKQPFYKQGGRAAAIVSGALVFTIGVGVTIGDM